MNLDWAECVKVHCLEFVCIIVRLIVYVDIILHENRLLCSHTILNAICK